MFNPLYFKQLLYLKEKHLTLREIDIIACFTSGKSVKTLSDFLGIGYKTFDTHWTNIKNKIHFSSKEHLLRHLEETGLRSAFFNHYLFLKIEYTLKKTLQEKTLLNSLTIFCPQKDKNYRLYSECLKRQLEYAGCQVTISVTASTPFQQNQNIILQEDKNKILNISFHKDGNHIHPHTLITQDYKHYNLIYEILYFFNNKNLILPAPQLLKKMDEILNLIRPENSTLLPFHNHTIKEKNKFLKYYIAIFLIISFLIGYVFIVKILNKTQHHVFLSFSQDLIKRPLLIEKIKNILSPEGISLCILMGMRGSGKTILSKQYIEQENCKMSFEIDAQSYRTIERSLYDIAKKLANDRAQHEAIDVVKYDNDQHKRIVWLLNFMKPFLKKNNNWIILYDNLTFFKELEELIPKDSKIWGCGKIIITTHNKNNLHYIPADKTIFIDKLSPDECADLLEKRLSFKPQSKDQRDMLYKMLTPLPLDINVFCSYVKAHKIDLLKVVNEQKDELSFPKRETLLYQSFLHIITEKNNDIFLFLGLCHFHNIPIKFIHKIFSKERFDDVANALKEYSLIESMDAKSISFHDFVHQHLMPFLFKTYDEQSLKVHIKKIILLIRQIVKDEKTVDAHIYEDLITHFEMILKNIQSLHMHNEEIDMHYILGYSHYYGSRHLIAAKDNFEYVLSKKDHSLTLIDKKALMFLLSVLYNDMGYDKMALQKIDSCLELDNTSQERATFLCQKGCILSFSNHFNDAQTCFDKAITLLNKIEENKNVLELKSTVYGEKAWACVVYFLTKNQSQAFDYIKKSLSYIPQKSENNISKAYCSYYTTLGSLFCKTGAYDQAMKEGFEKALYIIDHKLDGKTHHISKLFINEGVGEVLLRTGKLGEAKTVLKDVITQAYKLRGKSFSSIFIPKVLLMECYLRLNELENAENELMELLVYDLSVSSHAFLFMECLMHYNAAILYRKKNDLIKAQQFFSTFFKKIHALLTQLNGALSQEQEDQCRVPKIAITKIEDCVFFEKQAQQILKNIYPTVDFSHIT